MRLLLIGLFLSCFSLSAFAGKVSGLITDDKGNPLPYASISIKGTTRGTTSNSAGRYAITLSAGQYTLVCQYVGYGKSEKTITVTDESQVLDFSLSVQELTLGEVVVKKGEDPAYEIIRQAIKKRSFYNSQVDSFSVNVYIKGLIRSKGMPNRIFGKKIEREDNDGLDSLGQGIMFLSESLTRVDYAKPDNFKLKVISSRESGGGYGLSFPFFINFYQNNVSVFDNNLNPRGFISPIADGALNYYKYKYEGSFVEDGVMINTIKVTPRRKNEPLFSGTIQITEDDWRIYSADLLTTKNYSLEMLDTLRITQLHSAVDPQVWRTRNQVMYLVFKQLGFYFTGNFVNVYSDYNLQPGFTSKYFDRTVMKYDTAFNKKDTNYWNAVRPVALETDEKQNFVFKDSVYRVIRDSTRTRFHRDSLRKNQKPIKLVGIFWSGQSYSFYGKKSNLGWRLEPLLSRVTYNTVEGVSMNVNQTFSYWNPKFKHSYRLNWNTRYGFSNGHLNSYADFTISPKSLYYRNRFLKLSGGKRLSQFNHDNPIDNLTNAAYTLFGKKNYMKLYENWFGRIEYNNKFENGVSLNFHATYEDRIPVFNTTDFSFFNKDGTFTPNHPYELESIAFERSQAFVAGLRLSWQPGQYYIEYPWGKRPIPSKAPIFELEYNKGIKGLFGSDVNFDKWKFSVADNMNLKIGGEFKYRVGVGGFLNSDSVGIPDLQHFNGNQTFYNVKYLNSFQIAPYYQYSNSEQFYVYGHAEHHFNGLLTNKIPLFNRLKWYLVGGANTFYVNKNNYYVEVFAGLENIFKMLRVDFVNAYQPGIGNRFGVRVGFGGLIGGKVEFK